MAVDEQVRQLLRAVTPHPLVGVDVGEVRRNVRRRRTRGIAAVLAATVVLTGAGLVGVQLLDRSSSESTSPTHDPERVGWQRAAEMPLSPRSDPLTVWTGAEVLVIGGMHRDFVGGPAPFPDLSDGAAFDPATRRWRSIAAAPAAIGWYQPTAVVGDTVVMIAADTRTWLAYDIGDDTWRQLPRPPERVPQPVVAADPASGVVYTLDKYASESDAPVQVLDLRTDTWSSLPATTLNGRNDRSLVMTSVGLVLIGGQVERAALWDGSRWHEYPESDVHGGEWHWTGTRIVSTVGGEREGVLDPATGEWSLLAARAGLAPNAIPRWGNGLLEGGWPATDGPLVLRDGYLYDDSDGSFTAVRPPSPGLVASGIALGGGRLMTFGGYRVDEDQEPSRVMDVQLTNEVWVLDVD